MKGSKALLLTLAIAAGLLALVAGLRGPFRRVAAEHWRGQLETVPDRRAEYLLRQVVELGEPGIPVLVDALGSEREGVARAGKRILSEQLGRWQALGGSSGSRNQAVLAGALADRAARFGPTARGDAAELATRILGWLPNATEVDRGRVIAACEKVFQADGGRADLPPRDLPLTQRAASRRPSDSPQWGFSDGASIAELSRIPGGGLPIETAEVPKLVREPLDVPRTAAIDDRRPQRFQQPSDAERLPRANRPGDVSTAPKRIEAHPPTATVPEAPRAQPVEPSAPYAVSREGPGVRPASLKTSELMRQLHGTDVSAASAARTELGRRGFKKMHFELARRLFDPDPRVRRDLAQLLPAVQGIDAVAWLLQLCRDQSAEVRLAAIGIIATTGDPALAAEAERIARRDPDPRVRLQADRIAGRRTQRR